MSQPVRIPADVDRDDTVVANLTAHQLAVLAGAGAVLYVLWTLTQNLVPVPVFLVGAVPLGGAAAFVALGHRDGIPLDRLLLAALRQRLAPALRVASPEGTGSAPAWLTARAAGKGTLTGERAAAAAPLGLPVRGVSTAGVIDLGSDGLGAIAVCGTVNFALRTPTEQEALVAAFARYLHSLTAPVQLLVRAERLDLGAQITELHTAAPGLPHPALEAAAHEHAEHLAHLADSSVLLRRQVLLILREPLRAARPADGLNSRSPLAVWAGKRQERHAAPAGDAAVRGAEARLARRLGEAAELLGPAGITVTPLDARHAAAVLTAACDPGRLVQPSPVTAGVDDVITTPARQESAASNTGAVGEPDEWTTPVDPWTEKAGGRRLP
jgi:hypothetical protein